MARARADSFPRAATSTMPQHLAHASKPLALGLIAAAAIALASTTVGAQILIAATVAAFLILGPGLTLWQRTRKRS